MTGLMQHLVTISLLLILDSRESICFPKVSLEDSHISLNNSSQIHYEKTRTPRKYTYIQRKILSNDYSNGGNFENGMDGRIIFPTDDIENHRPQLIPIPKPTCENSTFCEYSINYPNELVEAALRMNKDLKLFSGLDMVVDVDVANRVHASSDDTPLCESIEKVVYPKVAENKNKEWFFVVNQGDFTQGVRVETCGKEDSVCNIIDGFTEGYTTTCKQKYIYRQLVAVSPHGQIKPEMFRFPASCCCHIKFTGNPLLRIGPGTNKKSNLPESIPERK